MLTKSSMKPGLFVLPLVIWIAGCSNPLGGPEISAPVAGAILDPVDGSTANATVTFSRYGSDGVVMHVRAKGLPVGGHGFFINEKSDCTKPDEIIKGGHLNPAKTRHGRYYHMDGRATGRGATFADFQPGALPGPRERHAGDLPQLLVSSSGFTQYTELLTGGVSLDSGLSSIVGRSITVHELTDDLMTQPDGAAGKIILCGVIEMNR